VSFELSRTSYETWKIRADAFSTSGSADGFTTALFSQMLIKLKLIQYLCFGSAFTGILCHRLFLSLIVALFNKSIKELMSFTEILWTATKNVVAKNRLAIGILFCIVIAGTISRVFFLFEPMRCDESYTFMHFAKRPLYLILSNYSLPNNHVLHSIAMHYSFYIFGNHLWALRLPALIAGLCLIPLTYLTAAKLYNTIAGIIAAILVASSAVLIDYSVDARGYTMVCMFTLLLILLAIFLQRSVNPFAWLSYSIIGALGLYTVPVMLYPIASVSAWLALLIYCENKQTIQKIRLWANLLLSLTVLSACTLLLYSPIILTTGLQSIFGNRFVTPLPPNIFLSELSNSFKLVWFSWNADLAFLASAMIGGGFLISLFLVFKSSKIKVPLLIGPLAVVPALLFLQKVAPGERTWLFLLLIYLISSAGGLSVLLHRFTKINRSPVPVRIFGIMIALFVTVALCAQTIAGDFIATNPEKGKLRAAKAMTLRLKSLLKSGDAIFLGSPFLEILEYYFYSNNLPLRYLNESVNTYLEADQKIFFIDKNIYLSDTTPLRRARREYAKLLLQSDDGSLYEFTGPRGIATELFIRGSKPSSTESKDSL
jgi:uncharacterized membrane protein